MKRIPPSERVRHEWQRLLTEGTDVEGNLLSILVRTAAQYMLQLAVEEEVTAFLGRGRYQRGKRNQTGLRNGYEPKNLLTGEGPIEIQSPQLRGLSNPYRSQLLGSIANRTETLNGLVRRMYVRGLSQRDVADTFYEVFDERLISKSTVSRIAKNLQAEFDAWRTRDLGADPVLYLFLDAVFLKTRQGERGSDAVLAAYGITETGKKVLLHLDLGEKESYIAWKGFLYNLVDRGLTQPVLVVSDGAPGLRKALREVYPRAIQQRCKVHKMRNILAKTPKSGQKLLKAEISKVYSAQDHKEALRLAKVVIERYQDQYPSAIRCFAEDIEECLGHLVLPPAHHKSTGTTNLIERVFGEGRRRTKVIGRFPNEGACLRLFFATLTAASQSWRGVRMTPALLAEVRQLRAKLYEEPTMPEEITKRRAS